MAVAEATRGGISLGISLLDMPRSMREATVTLLKQIWEQRSKKK